MPQVTLTAEGSVAVITIDNPEARNGLTPALSQRLRAICDEIDATPAFGAAVVRGAEGTFCSGADRRSWSPDLDWTGQEGRARLEETYGAFVRIGALEVPTIAAVRGAVVGAGLNLMLSCDLRIVADDARILAGFLRIGLHPGGGFFTLLGRLAGREAAAAMGLFGEELTGAQAVAQGLAWAAVPDAEVEPRALEMAATAARDPELVRHALRSLRTELGPPQVPWNVAVQVELPVQQWSMQRRFAKLAEES